MLFLTIARICESEPTKPAARICTKALPSAVPSFGPAITGIWRASAANCIRKLFLLPPPMT